MWFPLALTWEEERERREIKKRETHCRPRSGTASASTCWFPTTWGRPGAWRLPSPHGRDSSPAWRAQDPSHLAPSSTACSDFFRAALLRSRAAARLLWWAGVTWDGEEQGAHRAALPGAHLRPLGQVLGQLQLTSWSAGPKPGLTHLVLVHGEHCRHQLGIIQRCGEGWSLPAQSHD